VTAGAENDHLVFESTATCKCYNQCVLAEVWVLGAVSVRFAIENCLISNIKKKKKKNNRREKMRY